jgi:hypothetical protein
MAFTVTFWGCAAVVVRKRRGVSHSPKEEVRVESQYRYFWLSCECWRAEEGNHPCGPAASQVFSMKHKRQGHFLK